MSLTAGLLIVGPAMLAAWVASRFEDRCDRRAAVEPRRLPGRRFVDAPGFPQPLVHRVPGATIAAYRMPTSGRDTPSDLAPDNDTGLDIWVADYPPGSLGEHIEPAPDIPGRMTLEDGNALVTAAIRITRAAAGRRQSA